MLKVEIATDHQGKQIPLSPSQLAEGIPSDIDVLWVDAQEPSQAEIERFRDVFTLHPLAVEDISQPHQRAKIEVYGDDLFIVFYAISLENGELRTQEVDIFIGSNYVLTIHDAPLPLLEDVAKRWSSDAQGVSERDSGMLLYVLLDTIVDGYFPVLDAIIDMIEALDDTIFVRTDRDTQRQILTFRRTLLLLRHRLVPERDLLLTLLRRDIPLIDERLMLYFQDVYDHVQRATEGIDTSREILISSMETHLSVVSNDLNVVVKRLTAASIILMTVTLIPSIYGMNFEHMPELSWLWGYPASLIAMVVLGVVSYIWMRRHDWI